MNANELLRELEAQADRDGWTVEEATILIGALRLLAAAEANDGTTPETDALAKLCSTQFQIAEIARSFERERNGLAARMGELAAIKADYKACRAHAERAEAALAECRTKLEVDPRTKYDGIDCRDETIRMLEKELEESARLHGMGASREAALQARLAESERKCERLKFHAEAMAHYTDCYKDKWPDSGARQALEEYRAEFKEES